MPGSRADERRSDERNTFLVSRRVTTPSAPARDPRERSEQFNRRQDKTVDALLQAREAYERGDWVLAFDKLRGAGDLGPEDSMALATSAYLLGNVDDAVRALQAGYQDSIRNGDSLGAARFAFWLGLVLNMRGEVAVGGGWVAREQRLLENETADVVERGYVLTHEFFQHLDRGDFARADETAARVVETGRRFQDHDLIAQGLVMQGRIMIFSGRVPEGLALLDEAMIEISTAEVSPIVAGMVYCSMIEACQELSDFSRAASWTTALTKWCDAQPGLVPYTGQCSLHRGQIMRLRGAYDEALAEFALAQRRYRKEGTPAPAGRALTEQGDVLRIRGKFDEAEAAYRQAAELGHEPQPGLALAWLARGRTTAAVSAVRRLLAEARGPVQRSWMLPAAVEVLVSAGIVDQARQHSEELAGIASSFRNNALRAMATYAVATVNLASGETENALGNARESRRLWSDVESPYESARARVLVARALRELGDEDSATTEFAVARRAFAEVGAVPAAQEVDRLLGRVRPGGLTEREVEVLRLVAEGRGNHEIARVLVLSQKTVERHLSNIFTKLDVPSRTAAAAYAHEHGLMS
jgi:DNA-binding CsgD family transcriptional regulator/tetratricopeptide (TPR) repeat protein